MPEVTFNKQNWSGESMTIEFTPIENGFAWTQFDYQFTLVFVPFNDDFVGQPTPDDGVWTLHGDCWKDRLNTFFWFKEDFVEGTVGEYIVRKAAVWICNYV
jgi:hypothetical protein